MSVPLSPQLFFQLELIVELSLLPVVVFPFAIYFKRPTITTTITTALLLLLYIILLLLLYIYILLEILIFSARGHSLRHYYCRYWLDNNIATYENIYDNDVNVIQK